MELYPAIDLQGGEAVRLTQGDFARRTGYGDPLVLARRYAAAGARWLHVVDLDAARTGAPANRPTVLAIAAEVPAAVQAGGGVRSVADAAELLEGGVARVVLGTAAVRQPELVGELAGRYPGRVAVGLDHRAGVVATSGWEDDTGVHLGEVLERVGEVDLGAVVVTDIGRDGTLRGPDLSGLAAALAACPHPLIASGGVRSVADLARLAALEAGGRRLAGVIVGKALADGALDLHEALAACAASG